MNGTLRFGEETKMKKTWLIFTMLWVLLVSVWLLAEDAVRIDAQKRPKIVSQVKPVYPAEALKQKIQGAVELEATINTAGAVVGVKVLPAQTPQPLLEKAAVAALRQWKYAPYKINGKAKAVIFTVTITFALSDKKEEKQAANAFDTRPKRISDVKPVYPEEALKQGIQGRVLVEATIDEKGDVVAAKALPGENPQPLLEEAALTAVKQWKFEPFIQGGKAVKVTFTVTINFALK
jgi:TonB family protein